MASPAVQTPAVAAAAVETKTESKIKNGRGIVKQVKNISFLLLFY